jgi:Uma2 family endonuclease
MHEDAQLTGVTRNGVVLVMAGASLPHNEIVANVLSSWRTALRHTDCGAYGSDLRVQTPAGLYTYPDISVICGHVQLVPDRSATATNPVILVDVLPDATEEYDRGDKFTLYKSIPTLLHYILISQTEVLVEDFERIQPEEWQRRELRELNQVVQIPTPALAIALSDIFRRVF